MGVYEELVASAGGWGRGAVQGGQGGDLVAPAGGWELFAGACLGLGGRVAAAGWRKKSGNFKLFFFDWDTTSLITPQTFLEF